MSLSYLYKRTLGLFPPTPGKVVVQGVTAGQRNNELRGIPVEQELNGTEEERIPHKKNKSVSQSCAVAKSKRPSPKRPSPGLLLRVKSSGGSLDNKT